MPEFNIDGPGPPSGWWKEGIIEFPAFSGDSRASGLGPHTMSRAIGRGWVRIEIPMLTVFSLAFTS